MTIASVKCDFCEVIVPIGEGSEGNLILIGGKPTTDRMHICEDCVDRVVIVLEKKRAEREAKS